MATDLTIILEDRPGTMAEVGEALGKADVNIEGLCGFPCEGKGIGHVLVDNAESAAAREALERIGVEVRGERQVLVLGIADRPGSLAIFSMSALMSRSSRFLLCSAMRSA